jgi:AcrR family transcriptional regulator
MYHEYMTATEDTRRYRKRKRAKQEEETRRRITEAVVELHRTVGPANTKVTEVAELAGVSRMTVYNHFPSEADLVEACSTHWAAANPLPDAKGWSEIEDPVLRLREALRELYAFYARTQDMMGNVLRDAPLVPSLGEIMEIRWWRYVDSVVDVLAEGWPAGAEVERRAALRLVVDFRTWRVLTESGLDAAASAEVAAGMAACP